MTDPVLLLVDHDQRELTAFESALRRRYGADYRVLVERSPEAALDLLERLAEGGEDVALVAADLRLPGIDGVEFLERAHALHRGVVRALLVAMDEYHTRIPFKQLETIRHATALGRIDFWVVKGWTTPEEWLYPRVQEALSAWTTANRARHVVYRVVGERWHPRAHALRDTLTRNSVPFEFYPAGSGECDRLVGTSAWIQSGCRPSSATTGRCCTIRPPPKSRTPTGSARDPHQIPTIWRSSKRDRPG